MDDAHLPPGPGRPAALQAAWLAHRPFHFLEWCQARFGDTFTISIPALKRVTVFTRPDDVEQIFELDGGLLFGGAAQAPLVDFAGDRSLMKLDGKAHREHREVLAFALRQSGLPDGGASVLEHIRRLVSTWPIGRRFDVGAALDRLALDLVAELGLGGVTEELFALTSQTMRALRRASRPAGLLWEAVLPRGRSHFGRLRRVAEAYFDLRIQEADERATSRTPCVFERLKSGCPSRGIGLGPDGIRDEAMTLLAAMVAGLSAGMRHAFYWILRTPGTQSRLRGCALLEANDAGPEAIMSRPYLDSVCKEVLRLCPDIPFAVRRALAPVQIGCWRLPAGTTIGIGIYLIHRRAASFPDPERFWPERFYSARPSRFEYLPFGGGRRGCVAGPFFSFLQKLILAAVFEKLSLRLCDRRDNPVTSMAIVSIPSRSLWAIADPV
jgi:cytochrome P450